MDTNGSSNFFLFRIKIVFLCLSSSSFSSFFLFILIDYVYI